MKDISDGRRFMGLGRRLAIALGNTSFGSFVPTAEDDPADAGHPCDCRIGFGSESAVTQSLNTANLQAYRVVFNVYNDGTGRRVVAKVRGMGGLRSESEKFVRMVFDALR